MRLRGDRQKTRTRSCKVQGRNPKSPRLVDGKQARQEDQRIIEDALREEPARKARR